jgi:pimeloyl-ACP methyl ester carboxylesterase
LTAALLSYVIVGVPAPRWVKGPAAGSTRSLLHGVARTWRDWEDLLPVLAERWHASRSIAVVTARRRGRSATTVWPNTRDAASLVIAAFLEPVTVLGHSVGAMAALWVALAARHSR